MKSLFISNIAADSAVLAFAEVGEDVHRDGDRVVRDFAVPVLEQVVVPERFLAGPRAVRNGTAVKQSVRNSVRT